MQVTKYSLQNTIGSISYSAILGRLFTNLGEQGKFLRRSNDKKYYQTEQVFFGGGHPNALLNLGKLRSGKRTLQIE